MIEKQSEAMNVLQESALAWCEHIMALENHIKAQEEVINMAMDCFKIEKKVNGGISRALQIKLDPDFIYEFLEEANKNLHKKDSVLKVFRKTMPHFMKDNNE